MVVIVVYIKKSYITNYYHVAIVIIKNSNIKAKMLKTKGLGNKKIAYMKHKNTVMTHRHNIYAKSSDMEKETMCAYPQ